MTGSLAVGAGEPLGVWAAPGPVFSPKAYVPEVRQEVRSGPSAVLAASDGWMEGTPEEWAPSVRRGRGRPDAQGSRECVVASLWPWAPAGGLGRCWPQSEGAPVGTNETAVAGLTALSPSVLYPRGDPIHSCWSLVPVQMLSLPRFEHAFCCRKMKTMQPDVFLFLPWLPGASAKCVAQVLGALLPGFSSASSAFLQGALFRLTCPCRHLWAPPGPASWVGRGRIRETLTWGSTKPSNLSRCLVRLRPSDLRRQNGGEGRFRLSRQRRFWRSEDH